MKLMTFETLHATMQKRGAYFYLVADEMCIYIPDSIGSMKAPLVRLIMAHKGVIAHHFGAAG